MSFPAFRLPSRSAATALQGVAALAARHRFTRFLLVGVVNTLFGYGVFFAALTLTGHAILSALISTVAGVLFNFRSIGAFVFHSADKPLLTRFIAIYALLFVLNAAALAAMEALRVPPAAAQACLLPFLAILSYVLNRDLVFRPRKSGVAP